MSLTLETHLYHEGARRGDGSDALAERLHHMLAVQRQADNDTHATQSQDPHWHVALGGRFVLIDGKDGVEGANRVGHILFVEQGLEDRSHVCTRQHTQYIC